MRPFPTDLPPLPAMLPNDRSVALLLRHAERPPIAPGELGAELPLTPRGVTLAGALGHSLGAALCGIHTSPVRRCRETAEALQQGAGASALQILDDRMLGDPGAFVTDPARAWQHWRERGNERVVELLAWGSDQLPGLAAPFSAAQDLATHVLANTESGVHVFVTHDAILLPTVARLLPGVADRTWWPDFLECAAFWFDEDAPCVAYRALVAPLSPRKYS